MAEAGFFPGIILYLTYWFPARERARIVALFMAAVQLGIAALFFLDDGPRHARWLETGYHELGDALTRPRVLVLALLYFCIVVGLYGIGFWMPQVIQAYGRTPLAIGFLTAIPYLFAAIGMVLWAGIRIRPASASGTSRYL